MTCFSVAEKFRVTNDINEIEGICMMLQTADYEFLKEFLRHSNSINVWSSFLDVQPMQDKSILKMKNYV